MADYQIKVAIYSRVSTQEQVEGTSLEFQSQLTEDYCRAHGWIISQRYTDPGFTGKDGERPGLKRMLADANLGLFDKVLVYKLDRLARNLRLLLEIEEKLKKSEISINSLNESIDTSTAIGRTVFQVLGLAGEWEREAIIERTRSGRIQRYKEGKWAGGKPSFGYSYDKETKKLVINEAEARVVRRIYDMYSGGHSLNRIATILNEEKIKPRNKTGKGWVPSSVRIILLNPMYKGTLIVNRHCHISDIAKADMSKAIIISVPPIVPEAQWVRAQEHLEHNKQVRPVREERWLLQGLIRCGQCGYSYAAKEYSGLKYYICRGKFKIQHVDGSPRCDSKYVRAEWLEAEVWQRIEDILKDPNKLEPIIQDTLGRLRARAEELRARLLPIDEQLNEIEGEMARLADDFVVKHMNPEKFNHRKTELESEETRLKALRSSVDPSQLAELENTQVMLKFWENQVQAMAWNTENEDGSMVMLSEKPHRLVLTIVGLEDKELTDTFGFPATRREIIDKLQVKVVVFPDRFDVNAIFPIAPIYSQKYTPVRGGLRG